MTNADSYGTVFCDPGYNNFCIFDSNGNNLIDYYSFAQEVEDVTPLPESNFLNKWVNIAVSWNASNLRIYVNGQQQVLGNSTYVNSGYGITQSQGAAAFYLGVDTVGDNMNGYLDDVRIYSQSLQTADIEKIYAEGAAAHGIALK
jgi:hypothetical protein